MVDLGDIIRETIKILKNNKSPGLDSISAERLKCGKLKVTKKIITADCVV